MLSLYIFLKYTEQTTYILQLSCFLKQEIVFHNREEICATHLSSVNINDIAKKYVRQWYFLFLVVEYAPTDMALLYFSPKGKNQIVTQTLIIKNHLVPLSL